MSRPALRVPASPACRDWPVSPGRLAAFRLTLAVPRSCPAGFADANGLSDGKNGPARRPSRARAAKCSRAPRPAEAPPGKPGAPAVPKPGPVAHGPRRPGGYPQARRPPAAAGAGRAPPVTAAVPPHEPQRPRTGSIPGLHTPRRCPGRINPPEPARVKAGWRTRGGYVENASPAPRGRFLRATLVITAVIVGVGAAASMRPAWRGHRSQADAARTRPPSPPKLVRAAQPE
jgi:hypothetical protein